MIFLISTEITNPPHPSQVNYELTCCHKYKGDKGEEADQDEGWDEVFREGRIDGVEDKLPNNHLN